MIEVRLAVLTNLKPANIGINNSQIATIITKESEDRGYVKQIQNDEIAIEVICSVVGRLLGLDIPEPIICRHDNQFYFGSIDARHPNLKQAVKLGDNSVYGKLIGWSKLLDSACFDGWIGNPDRHGGNVLFDGKDKFILIDHGLSLRSKSNRVNNYLMKTVELRDSKKDEVTKQRTKKQTRKIISTYQYVNYKDINISIPIIYSHINNLVKLLEDRLNNIDALTIECITPAQDDIKYEF